MEDQFAEVEALLVKYLREELTADEQSVLEAWVAASPDNQFVFEELRTGVTAKLVQMYGYDLEKGWEKIVSGEEVHSPWSIVDSKTDSVKTWKRVAIAASLVGILFLGYWVMREKTTDDGPQITVTQPTDIQAPDKVRAQIKLADGRIVYLDSAGNGELASINGVQLLKTADGRIEYNGQLATGNEQLVYNTLMNPRGSQVIDLTLSDGSRVWLNAGSSVTYPIAFNDKERKVSVTGEAYFEVAHDKRKPFFVSKGDMTVQVLGTKFNVNAYDDETDIRVTLLEGSVRVSTDVRRQTTVLRPGQQAKAAVDGGLSTVDNVDLDAVMAWKNDLFLLDNTDLATLLRQIGRWYDVEIKYGVLPNRTFGGGISRKLPLSKVLEMLAANGIQTKLEGKVLTIQK